ncbi:MAG: leucine-rich repeat protein [Clostridia bacterium]|nr:leucine-rich repeat protein [Clostridia bacterium]
MAEKKEAERILSDPPEEKEKRAKKLEKKKKSAMADPRDYEDYKNSIPEDEIWTWQIEGLQAPHVHKEYHNAALKKFIVVIVLLVSIGLAIYFSVRAVHNVTYKYQDMPEGGVMLVKFSNPGDITEVTLDFADGDENRPITALREYAFNCDEKITEVTIGRDVTSLDGKTFYTCNALKAIHVDPDNPAYCDLDGVLFTKDLTELICYPIDHDQYLRDKYGYDRQYWPEDAEYDIKYELLVNTYVVPPEVRVIGKLAFNYAELFNVYLPEGLERIETLGFFRNWHLADLRTYTGEVTFEPEGKAKTSKDFTEKPSLPDSLTFIGSDAFNSAICINYLYIPANVQEIGHHAFWGMAENEDDRLVKEIYIARSEEDFKKNVKTGDQWMGQYDHGLFPKNTDVVYGQTRKTLEEIGKAATK